MADSERGETCPDCGTRVPVDPGFTAWCDCGWNIAPGERSASPTRIEAIYGRMGERFGRSLFEEVLERGAARPGRSATRLLLLAVSAAVLATPVATAVGAVLLACSFPGNVFAWGAAVVLALLTWVVRPRPGRVPRGPAR